MALDVLGRIGGDHEKALREYFGAGAIYTGEPVSDRPLYLMAFTNRCGSNLLAAYLNALRDFAGFDEELNHFRAIPICRREGIVTLPDYLLWCARSSGDAIYGFKANWEQLGMVFRMGLDRLYAGVRVIHVRRLDTVGQAVSHAIASQTDQWTSLAPSRFEGTVRYDYDDIAKWVNGIVFANQMMHLIVSITRTPCLEVIYENLVENPAEEVARVAAWAGSDCTLRADFRSPIQKQATPLNEDFRERFLSEAGARTLYAGLSAASLRRPSEG